MTQPEVAEGFKEVTIRQVTVSLNITDSPVETAAHNLWRSRLLMDLRKRFPLQ